MFSQTLDPAEKLCIGPVQLCNIAVLAGWPHIAFDVAKSSNDPVNTVVSEAAVNLWFPRAQSFHKPTLELRGRRQPAIMAILRANLNEPIEVYLEWKATFAAFIAVRREDLIGGSAALWERVICRPILNRSAQASATTDWPE